MVVKIKIFVLLFGLFLISCTPTAEVSDRSTAQPQKVAQVNPAVDKPTAPIQVGAARPELYLEKLRGKRLGLVVNQTTTVGEQHLVDFLLENQIEISRIFAPEHGFRGTADAGAKIEDGRDPATGIPIVSLYGKKRAPDEQDLATIDVLIFDIQDVGARFYTYISTMYYVMEAAAKNKKPLLILDRPNPNGHYVDGPVLDPAFSSFVGMHPVPVVHGMTIGEYARMVIGEGWLPASLPLALEVVPCANYEHNRPYTLPVKPSPNLPNQRSIYLYPWLCYFEGTEFSVGRGTDHQFQVYGAPDYPMGSYQFTPVPKPGAQHPKHEGVVCYGASLVRLSPETLHEGARLDLSYLVQAYKNYPKKESFFLKSNFFDRLAGSDQLRKQLIAGMTEAEIRASWEPALTEYKQMRQKYLLYP